MKVKLVYKIGRKIKKEYFSDYHNLNKYIVNLLMCNEDVRIYIERSC